MQKKKIWETKARSALQTIFYDLCCGTRNMHLDWSRWASPCLSLSAFPTVASCRSSRSSSSSSSISKQRDQRQEERKAKRKQRGKQGVLLYGVMYAGNHAKTRLGGGASIQYHTASFQVERPKTDRSGTSVSNKSTTRHPVANQERANLHFRDRPH